MPCGRTPTQKKILRTFRVDVPGSASGPMPKRHLEGTTQEARAKKRREIGPLRQLTVQPVTKARYQQALDDFFEYLRAEKLVLPHSTAQLDTMVADYLEHLWAQGFG